MSNVLLCKGTLSTIPYYIKEACVSIYSIEELCYFVYHNSYMLDDSFVNDSLVEWISDKLELKEIARQIDKVRDHDGALGNLVRILNNEIGYCTEEEWIQLLEDIAGNSRISLTERRKIRADGLLNSGKYAQCLKEYEGILRDESVKDEKLLARVYHNLGVCAAKLFLYERAADYFEKAYESYANTESYIEMLCAKKMYMKPTEYLNYLAEHKESYEDSLEVERKFEMLKLSFSSQPSYMYFRELEQMKREGNSFYGAIEALTNQVKENYRGY